MNNKFLVIFLSIVFFLSLFSKVNAVFYIQNGPCGRYDTNTECQRKIDKLGRDQKKAEEKAEEEARLYQAKLESEKKTEQKRLERLAEEEKENELKIELEKLTKEVEYQTQIKQLEDRIKNLESKDSTIIITPHVIKNQEKIITSTQPIEKIQLQKEEVKEMLTEEETVSETILPVVQDTPPSPPKKISWFKKIINWFSIK